MSQRNKKTSSHEANTNELLLGLDLMFLGHMALVAAADEVLKNYSFGRPHHRVLYLVARHPGITVNEILSILRVTSQALTRVFQQLIEHDLIVQRLDPADRRKRRHYVTPKGAGLDKKLCDRQLQLLADAFGSLPHAATVSFFNVLDRIVMPEDREWYSMPVPDLPAPSEKAAQIVKRRQVKSSRTT
ncbi:MarR family winged helix-turn-helix transcriptional regulator [Microvirga sp. 2YAF29]|uniref:MarR family winged helix-turn-helix transcriptional regulator n=1 Tax=Microvirga sp. 2YAF29 TaxID=3233031 RepID=UPI003F9995BC